MSRRYRQVRRTFIKPHFRNINGEQTRVKGHFRRSYIKDYGMTEENEE